MEATGVANHNEKLERLFSHLLPPPRSLQLSKIKICTGKTLILYFVLPTPDTPDTNCGDLRVALYRDLTYVLR